AARYGRTRVTYASIMRGLSVSSRARIGAPRESPRPVAPPGVAEAGDTHSTPPVRSRLDDVGPKAPSAGTWRSARRCSGQRGARRQGFWHALNMGNSDFDDFLTLTRRRLVSGDRDRWEETRWISCIWD